MSRWIQFTSPFTSYSVHHCSLIRVAHSESFQMSRGVSFEEDYLVPEEPPRRRYWSADDIDRIQPSRSSSTEPVGRYLSEGHIGSKSRRARVDELEREILSSRSLFDSRAIPRDPTSIVLPEITCGTSTIQPIGHYRRLLIRMVRWVRIVQHYFVFLQLGIVTAIIWANIDIQSYDSIWQSHDPHALSVHFFVNDVFMALFFGVAMVHVTTAMRPGGSLFPFKKALTPLLGTVGGVAGPAGVYLALVAVQGSFKTQSQGWAICIATDISMAWLVATQVFGSGKHPAVEFLLLLAVVDDVIGLIVIAVCFPTGEMHLIWLLLLLGSVCISIALRWVLKAERWWYYIFLAGPVAWYGLYRAGVHPALALCVVVPFIPGDNIEKFDHNCSLFVHVGLFFFALCNAGVVFDEIGLVTLNVAISLVIGKTIGIFTFTYLGTKLFGLKLPEGMGKTQLGVLAHLSGVGLTVALFVSEMAFTDPALISQARLGALISIVVAPISLILGRVFHISTNPDKSETLSTTV